MSHPLERLVRRVQNDPYFLASVLAAYARSEGLDDSALATKLTCAATELTALRLCRAPRPEAPLFGQDVEQIAQRFRLNTQDLAEMVRRGQSLLQLQGSAGDSSSDASGLLIAARDQPRVPPATAPEGDSP